MAATGSTTRTDWFLCCRNCQQRIVPCSYLVLTLVGCSGVHVQLKESDESVAEHNLEKTDNPTLDERERTPFKTLCKTCQTSIGAFSRDRHSFKACTVFFKNSLFGEKKWKKWSGAKDELPTLGIIVEQVPTVSRNRPANERVDNAQPMPLVFCDTTLTSDATIDRLTRDKPRGYQRELFKYAMEGNSLVCLPTGCGKTMVAAMAVACMTHLNPHKLAVFLAPTVPLVHQQDAYLKRQLPNLRIQYLTSEKGGEADPFEFVIQNIRSQPRSVNVLVFTPQIFLNFLTDETILQMSDVSLIVLDEAHGCTGNHPYVKLMESYAQVSDPVKPLVLALTASPANGPEIPQIKSQLETLLTRLHCKAIVPRKSADNLKQYWHRPVVACILKQLNTNQKRLENCLEKYLKATLNPLLMRLLTSPGQISNLSAHLVQSGNYKGILRNAIADARNKPESVQGMALAEHAIKVISALEMNSLLGWREACRSMSELFSSIEAGQNPMDALRRDMITRCPGHWATASELRRLEHSELYMASSLHSSDRFQVLLAELRRFATTARRGDDTCRAIVFVKMRRTCTRLCEELRKDTLIRDYLNPNRFIGHGKGTFGMDWKEDQEPVLKDFHAGRCKLLVSTSVLEEGLDVPACNLVIRFDSVLNMRALVQSRGRAARRADSRFVVMCQDEQEKVMLEGLNAKETNVENAFAEYARLSCAKYSARMRGEECETQKLDASYGASVKSRKTRNKKRRKRAPPQVVVTLQIETKQAPPVGCFGTTHHGQRASKACRLFQKYFNVLSYEPAAPASPDQQLARVAFRLEAHRQHSLRTEFELFDAVQQTWCSEGEKGSWLEQSDEKAPSRKAVVHVLPIHNLTSGDFKDRATFSQLWTLDCRRSAEVLFLHDLKLVTIVFYSPSSVLHKIEFRYDQIQDFIVLDAPSSLGKSCNMYLCLRHVPTLSAADSYLVEFDGDATFRGYFLPEEPLNDEASRQEQEASSDVPDHDAERPHDDDVDGSDGESIESYTPVEYLTDDASDSEIERPDIELIDGDNEPPLEQVSIYGDEISAVDSMVKVNTWKRRYQIGDNEDNEGHDLAFGNFLTLKITLPYSLDLCDALQTMKSSFGKRIFYAPFHNETQSSRNTVMSLPDEARYAHDCLISLHPNVRPRLSRVFYNYLERLARVTECSDVLYQMSFALSKDYFADPESTLNRTTVHTGLSMNNTQIPAHCTRVKRLVLTPTRVIPFPPEIMEQNRVLRNFDPQNFLCVNIRDEDYSRLRGHLAKINEVLERIKGYMKHGIVVGGLKYEFVGCSNSQMRGHGCWFVHPTMVDNASSMRAWMGDFTMIRCVAAYLSRMGQCFSTSTDALGISLYLRAGFRLVNDVKRHRLCFSDGIGTISSQLIREVCRSVGKAGTRSALQIRLAGCKGVLCEDPTLPNNRICVRESMKKFDSNHQRLEVLQTSRAQAVFLNHQTIMLLSNLGVPDEVFLELQRKMLDNLAEMMLDEKEALQRLSCIVRTGINYKMLSENGVSLTTEPYFKAMLCALYKERMNRLLKKSRILLPVETSRLMMGVMDETGVLRYGQVFVQCSHMISEGDGTDDDDVLGQQFIVKQRVVVTRNPCLHPGDVRVLDAVDVPALRHIVDCIVFPQHGVRPHPNEMAGGDLDGDLYFVSWNEALLPRRDVYPPMEYPPSVKQEQDEPITVDDMINFYMEYVEYEQLGVIDNAHKAWADITEDGVESIKCLKLAQVHSLAVDAPKTGEWVVRPADLAPPKYPDFMKDPYKPSYVSHKVLGQLFRECRDFEETTMPSPGLHTDTRFLEPGFQLYLQSAAVTYTEYASQVTTLMTLYAITTEAEMMAGCFHKLQGEFGRERTHIAYVVRRLLCQLRTNFRTEFFKEFLVAGEQRLNQKQVTQAMKQKASAWYHCAYTASEPFVSFPWVVDDVLVTVYHGTQSQTPIITENLTRSIDEMFTRDQPALVQGYKTRSELRDDILRAINTRGPREGHADNTPKLLMFGSSASLLFRPNSDVDLCVITTRGTSQVETLQGLEPSLKQAFGQVHLVKDAKVPVMRLGSLISPATSTLRHVKLSCDISANHNGLLKTTLLLSYFKLYPWLLPLLRVVVAWAHAAGLTNKVESFRINTNVLIFMFLSFCIEKCYIKSFKLDAIRSLEQSLPTYDNVPMEFWESLFVTRPASFTSALPSTGHILLRFFQYRDVLCNSIPDCFQTVVNATSFMDLLNIDDIQLLREQMQKAYHVLAIHGNCQALLQVCSAPVQRTFALSSLQSLDVSGNERSYARDLSIKTGAYVTVRPNLPGSRRGLVLEARGPIAAIRILERVLGSVSETPLNRMSIMSKCFVQGATMITFEGCQGNSDHVTPSPYTGDHHQTHDKRQRHVVTLKNLDLQNTPWEDTHAYKQFSRKFLDQLLVIRRDYDSTIHGKLQFLVHFGRIYVFDIPKALEEDSDPLTIEDLQYPQGRGRNPQHVPKPRTFRRPGGSGKMKVKSRPKKKTEDTKREQDKTTNHSLFTVVSDGCLQDIRDELERRGYEEKVEHASVTYAATVRVGCKEIYVSYDDQLNAISVALPRLRWFLADVKRPWQQRLQPSTTMDGNECDFRFILRTSREFPPDEVRAGDHYAEYLNILGPSPTGGSAYPFSMDNNLRKHLQLVRRKEMTVFTPRVHGMQGSRETRVHDTRAFRETKVCLSKITEYSRFKPAHGKFGKVFDRHEMIIQPAMPANWEDEADTQAFLRTTWELASGMASTACT